MVCWISRVRQNQIPQCSDIYTHHFSAVIMRAMTSQVIGASIVYSDFCPGAYQRKLQSFTSLDFVTGIHRWPMNSPRQGPVTRKMFPFDDIIMNSLDFCRSNIHIYFIRRHCFYFCLIQTSGKFVPLDSIDNGSLSVHVMVLVPIRASHKRQVMQSFDVAFLSGWTNCWTDGLATGVWDSWRSCDVTVMRSVFKKFGLYNHSHRHHGLTNEKKTSKQ